MQGMCVKVMILVELLNGGGGGGGVEQYGHNAF